MVSRTIAWRIPANGMGKMEEKLPPALWMFSAEDAKRLSPGFLFQNRGALSKISGAAYYPAWKADTLKGRKENERQERFQHGEAAHTRMQIM